MTGIGKGTDFKKLNKNLEELNLKRRQSIKNDEELLA